MNQSLYVSHYRAVISMKYDSGRKLREQQRTRRHSRCTSPRSPATPPGDNATAARTAARWENWRGRGRGNERLGLNSLPGKNLGCLCRERENVRDIPASLFFKVPSCFWNPWAPFTPRLYLYHKKPQYQAAALAAGNEIPSRQNRCRHCRWRLNNK